MNFWEDDIQILARDEVHRLPEYVNAMQNSSGGVIKIEGGSEIPVEPLDWRKKPLALGGQVRRRVEGQNVICGAWAKSVMASRDAWDDFAVDDSLNAQSLERFCERVRRLHPELEELSSDELMRSTGIFSGKYLTSAGVLMLGEVLEISAALDHEDIHAELHAVNIWEACSDVLPRLTRSLSGKCSPAVRELIVNAFLHADYSLDNHISIFICSNPARIVINNPGVIINSLRNHRLAKLFRLSGLAECSSRGMQRVMNYAPAFRLEQDFLNFRTTASLELEGILPVML